jgi:hypothetical protein
MPTPAQQTTKPPADQQLQNHLAHGQSAVTGMQYAFVQTPRFITIEEIEEKTLFEKFIDAIMKALGLRDDKEGEPLPYKIINSITIPLANPIFGNAYEKWQNGYYNGNWQQAIHDVTTQLDHTVGKMQENGLSPQAKTLSQIKDGLKQLEEKGLEQKWKECLNELRQDPKWIWDEKQKKDLEYVFKYTPDDPDDYYSRRCPANCSKEDLEEYAQGHINDFWNEVCQEQAKRGIAPPNGMDPALQDKWQDYLRHEWQVYVEDIKIDIIKSRAFVPEKTPTTSPKPEKPSLSLSRW